MLIQFNTDNHLRTHQELVPELEAQLQSALAQFATQLTRVEAQNRSESGELELGS